MKRNKQTFNNLLRRYNKYLRKLENLKFSNRNLRRQGILSKHIERLFEKLTSLKLSMQKGVIATTLVVGALAFAPQEADAQGFKPVQVNPFSLGYVDTYNNASFEDLDNDGDLDFIGSGYYSDLYYFENTGTASAPAFAAPQTNPFGLARMGDYYGTAILKDLDNDGDFDIMGGTTDGNFYYFENTGTANAPVFAAAQVNPFSLTYIGNSYATPSLIDLDGDGDFDLMSHEYGGDFLYFENIGTVNAPVFAAFQTNPFSLANLGTNTLSAPSFGDFDGDGDMDIISSDNSGDLIYYENTGTASVPTFGPAQVNPFGLASVDSWANPTFVDLNNDGDLDVMAGDSNGDFSYFEACTPSTSTISPVAACSYTSPSGNNLWTVSNTYMDTIPNASGCDSVITINLTVNPTITDQNVSAANPVLCGSGSTTIDVTSSESGVSYYLRDNTNDTIIDGPVTGNGSGISLNTGTISSAMTYNVYSENPINTGALSFDGVDDKVDCGNAASVQLSGTQITLEAWIFPTGWKGAVWGGTIINKEESGPDQGYMIRCGNNGQISFNLGDGNWDELTSSTGDLILNTWQHVAATYDGSTMSIFVDGVLVASQPSTISFLSPNENLTIGNWSLTGDRVFIGEIDEARVWSVARTQTEIQTDMNNCLAGSEVGLAAYYQFEDGIGSATLTDLTANGNNGTLTNMNPVSDWVTGMIDCVPSACSLEMTQTATVTFIPSVDTSTATIGFIITSNQTGATYQWIDCNNANAAIVGETSINYTATANGDYAVVVSLGSCSDTSACVNINGVGISELESSTVKTYPNPVTNLFTIELDKVSNNTQISVMNVVGKVVYNKTNINNAKLVIDATDWKSGVYFIQINNDDGKKTVKLIKQ